MFIVIFIICQFFSIIPSVYLLNKSTAFENFENVNGTFLVRKCCPIHHYYNSQSNECGSDDSNQFQDVIQYLLHIPRKVDIYSEKIKVCPESSNESRPPQIKNIDKILAEISLENGKLHDYDLGHTFNMSHYCLEMVGENVETSSLFLAYCLETKNVVPKCCPKNHFFDTREFDCHPYFNVEETETNLLDRYLSQTAILSHDWDLECTDSPVLLNLDETKFIGNNLCITKSEPCFNTHEYCIDNVLNEENILVPSTYVCPKNFLNKCCPDGLSLHQTGCHQASKQSISMNYFLKNTRYQVKSISHLGFQCSPITVEENTRTEIKWHIDIDNAIIVDTPNKAKFKTRNYCIDDFENNDEVVPVVKLCSEEIGIYHEVSSLQNWSDKILGKCCPSHTIYNPINSSCIETSVNTDNLILSKEFVDKNISHFVFSSFPNCSSQEFYYKYDLKPSDFDYAELTYNRTLIIVRKDQNCIIKKTEVEVSNFCVDVVSKDDEYKVIAVICTSHTTNPHVERNPIFITLIAVSCIALIFTFLSLVLMRVRRGMLTIKKIKTLAGRILTSYVVSLLIGYIVLAVGIFFDFKEEGKCFVFAGFLMYFMFAAFFWNTSICLEGLFLTIHLQISECKRYFCHAVWGWGFPGLLTALVLLRDLQRDSLPCGAITPKIGVERCFFSDHQAMLLYFYLPISISVLLNACLLIAAKFLRIKKLKNLAKYPHKIRRHEPVDQKLSIKNLKTKLRCQISQKPFSDYSGLRTHQTRNVWVESLKLVLWSGTTWLMEVLGSVVVIYFGRSEGQWLFYLWYLPVGFNCLRGLGVFIILVFTNDNKSHLLRTARSLNTTFHSTIINRFSPTIRQSKDGSRSCQRNNNEFNFSESQIKAAKKGRSRSISVSTIVTNISNSTLGTPNCDVESCPDFSYSNQTENCNVIEFSEANVHHNIDSINGNNSKDFLQHLPTNKKQTGTQKLNSKKIFIDIEKPQTSDNNTNHKSNLHLQNNTLQQNRHEVCYDNFDYCTHL